MSPRPLTVTELIEQLSSLPGDLPVACAYDGGMYTGALSVSAESLEAYDYDGDGGEGSMQFAVIGEVDCYDLDLWVREQLFGGGGGGGA